MRPATLSIRVDRSNPLHHLWNNHGKWWCHFTLHRAGRKRRVRLSLETGELGEAVTRRDALFRALGWGGSALTSGAPDDTRGSEVAR